MVDGWYCYGSGSDYDNATITVDVKLISDAQGYFSGIAFRFSSADANQFYEFGIDSGGDWSFLKHDDTGYEVIVSDAPNPAIHSGYNVANTLQVIGAGSTFDLSVNGIQVGQAVDASYVTGYTGFAAGSGAVAVFSNLTIAA